MAKSPSLEDELARVRALRARPLAEVPDTELRALIDSRHGAVVKSGAEMAADGRRAALTPALIAAFDRLLVKGDQRDKGCLGKTAIANALCALDLREEDVFLRGVACVQLEPSFGATVDTAGELRGRCAVALAEMGHPDAILEAGPMLVDGDAQARVGAVRALGATGQVAASAALRLKALVGDEEPVVMEECFAALLGLSEKNLPFVAGFVDRPGVPADTAEAAVSALAASRRPEALTILRQRLQAARDESSRRTMLRAIAQLRVDEAQSFLLDLLTHDLHPRAKEVLDALSIHRRDPSVRKHIEAALAARDDKFLERYYREVFVP